MEQIWPTVCRRDPQENGQQDARIFKLAGAFGRGVRRDHGDVNYIWRAVDHEGEVLESFVTKRRDRKAALKFLRKTMKRHGRAHIFVTDKLRSYGAALKVIGKKLAAGKTKGLRIHTNRLDEKRGRCFALEGREL